MTINVTFEAGDGFSPRIIRIVTTDSLATVTTAGWLNQVTSEGIVILPTDQLLISYSTGVNFFTQSMTNGIYTVVLAQGDVVLPVTNGEISLFLGTTGAIGASTASASVPAITTYTNSSATPGTIRSLFGAMSSSATTQTSGNLVGVRGSVTYVGASGGFLYGVQGKLIPSGTISGSSWNAGVFGQLDISSATINAGQMAPIWGDYGSSSHTLTDQTGLYGIAMTNTTAAVLRGQLYLYGGATNLMYLNTNAGLSGTTYFKAAGTSSGSAGYASGCNATEVLTISVNGTTYYIPCFAQNT